VLRQASTASKGAGRATIGEGAEQALSSGRKATEETNIEQTRRREQLVASDAKPGPSTKTGDSAREGEASQASDTSTGRKINIGSLNEEELLNMIGSYLILMIAFAERTRNVHKELKDTLKNTGLVMKQYIKIKISGQNGKTPKESKTKVHRRKKPHSRWNPTEIRKYRMY